MRNLLLAALSSLCLFACGGNNTPNDAGTETQDAGCDLNAGDSFKGGDYLDAGTGGTGSPPSVTWNQECSRVPAVLRSGGAENGFCTVADSCKEVSCLCASNSKTYAAAACSNGGCKDIATACNWAVTREPRLCQ